MDTHGLTWTNTFFMSDRPLKKILYAFGMLIYNKEAAIFELPGVFIGPDQGRKTVHESPCASIAKKEKI